MPKELEFKSSRSPCVLWRIKLPRLNDECVSPVFDLDGCVKQIKLKTHYISGSGNSGSEYCKISVMGIREVRRGIFWYVSKENGEKNFLSCHSTELRKDEFVCLNHSIPLSYFKNWRITGDMVTMAFSLDSISIGEISEIPCSEICSHLSLSEDIGKLFDKEESSDVVLKCGDRKFFANKLILSARSEVLQAMFKNKMSESKTGVVIIEDIQPSILEQFLHFLYSGKVQNLRMDSAFDLYRAGEKYAVSSLKRTCASFMQKQLSVDNVCEILLLAETFTDVELLDAAASFVASRIEFLRSRAWSDFSDSHLYLGVQVLKKIVSE